jgi:putative ABC transport system ATP-binding protein
MDVLNACGEPTLQGRRLTRVFEDGATQVTALADVSLELFPGQVTLVMGPSGSGKSTLLAVLSGLLRPTSGSVHVLGKDLWVLSDRERQHLRLRLFGFVFQGFNLFPALTARQQLALVLRWGEGVAPRLARQRADELLGRLGLLGRAALRPAQLSAGEKQRVAVARALIKEPICCFADEPTSALDWGFGRQVIELLHHAAHVRRAAVLIVSHDDRIMAYADRVCYLEDGRLRQTSESRPPASEQRTT